MTDASRAGRTGNASSADPAVAGPAHVPPGSVRAASFAAITVLFVVLQIYQSLDQGRLAFPATYDDTAYFRDGLLRLHALFDRGVASFAGEPWTHAPHSAWSVLVTFIGFALFGPHDWAPAAISGAFLILASAALAFVLRGLALLPGLALLVGVLTWPILGHLVLDARPDMVWGLALATFTVVIAESATRRLSRQRAWLAVGLLTLAVLSKATTLPVTIAVVGTVFAAALLARHRNDPDGLRTHAIQLVKIAALAGAFALPFYAMAGRELFDYVTRNVFGQHAKLWELPLDARGHALYHLTGNGGRAMLGAWLWLWLVTFLAFAAALARHAARGTATVAACFAAAFLVGWLAVTLPSHKSPYIGAIVPACFLVSWLAMNVFMLDAKRSKGTRRIAGVTLAVTLAIGLASFQWPFTLVQGPPSPERFIEIAKRHADVAGIIAALDDAEVDEGSVFVVGAAPYLNADTLRYYAIKQRRDGIVFDERTFIRDTAAIDKLIQGSRGVLLFSADHTELIEWLPGNDAAYLAEVAKVVARDRELEQVAQFPAFQGAGALTLYLRRAEFQIKRNSAGFGPVEGPFPRWGLPKVRWGLGPASRFVVPARAARLAIEAQTAQPDQVLTVVVDGVETLKHRFAALGRPDALEVDLPPSRGAPRVIELRYARWADPTAGDPRKMAVLFRRIQWN
jgi:hypothetical protein